MGASRKIGGLTKPERDFVRAYVKTGNVTKSAEIAYPNQKKKHIAKQGSKVLCRDRVKKKIIEILDNEGLTDEYIAKSLKHNIDEGVGVDANANTANKSLEIAIKLRGIVENKSKSNLNMYLFKGMKTADSKKILDKRRQINDYFDKIMDADELPVRPPDTPVK